MTCNNYSCITIFFYWVNTYEPYCSKGCQLICIPQKSEQSDMRNPMKTNPPWKPLIKVTTPATLEETTCPDDPPCQD